MCVYYEIQNQQLFFFKTNLIRLKKKRQAAFILITLQPLKVHLAINREFLQKRNLKKILSVDINLISNQSTFSILI